MPELIHLDTNSFVLISVLFLMVVLYALKKDIEDITEHRKHYSLNEYNSNKSRVNKIYKDMSKSALRGIITGSILGGPGGAIAGGFVFGISGGLVTGLC